MQRVRTMPGVWSHTDHCLLFLNVHQSDSTRDPGVISDRKGLNEEDWVLVRWGRARGVRIRPGHWLRTQCPSCDPTMTLLWHSLGTDLASAEAAAGGHFLIHTDIENLTRASHWRNLICIQKSGSGRVWECSLDFPASAVSGHPWEAGGCSMPTSGIQVQLPNSLDLFSLDPNSVFLRTDCLPGVLPH